MEEYNDKPRNFIEEQVERDLANEPRVQTRFPPEPNGYLHIGHAKALCIDFEIARKYGGKCNLRFDDTNPAKEDTEYVDAIKEDINWLGFQWDKLCFGSDYFDQCYELAEKLIKKGKAYVCDLDKDQIREYRGTLTEPGVNSPYRERSIEENLDLFRRMRAGEFEDGTRTLRAKIDMASPNINMRDPAIYRILHKSHHHTGDKWCIYPMYDFAHPIQDAIEGVTHSLCSLEYEIHRPLYDWVVNECEFEHKPRQIEFARLNLTNTVMSKRYLRSLVESGVVDGWDDPRMPTLCGMRRKGYPAAAIVDFLGRVGVAKADSIVDSAMLESCVRDALNLSAHRMMAVTEPLRLVIDNLPEDMPKEFSMQNLPGGEGGTHSMPFSRELFIEQSDFMETPPPKYHRLTLGAEVRLKDSGIVKCVEFETDKYGAVTIVHCTIDPTTCPGGENAARKVKGTIHWVDAHDCIPAEFRYFEPLLLDVPDVDPLDFEARKNPDSLCIRQGYVENALRGCKSGDTFQFVRSGYFTADKTSTKDALVFNRVVDLKGSFKLV